jgi:hypothetical protein
MSQLTSLIDSVLQELNYVRTDSPFEFSIINIDTKLYEKGRTSNVKVACRSTRQLIDVIMLQCRFYDTNYDIFNNVIKKMSSNGDDDHDQTIADTFIQDLSTFTNRSQSKDDHVMCAIFDDYESFLGLFCRKRLKEMLKC